VTDVWIANDEGTELVRARDIAVATLDYNGNVTVRLGCADGAVVTLVAHRAHHEEHRPGDLHRQLIRVLAELSDVPGAILVHAVHDQTHGWQWVTEPLYWRHGPVSPAVRPASRTHGKTGGTGERQGRILVMMKHPRAAGRPFLPTSPFGAPALTPPAEQFAVQDQVTHDKYGLGRVISVEEDTILIIDFGSRRVQITTPCAKLTKL